MKAIRPAGPTKSVAIIPPIWGIKMLVVDIISKKILGIKLITIDMIPKRREVTKISQNLFFVACQDFFKHSTGPESSITQAWEKRSNLTPMYNIGRNQIRAPIIKMGVPKIPRRIKAKKGPTTINPLIIIATKRRGT